MLTLPVQNSHYKMARATSDDIACFNIAMSMNNIAVSLIDKRCHPQAIEVFCDALTLLKSGHPPEEVALVLVSKANRYMASCQQNRTRPCDIESRAAPYFVSDEDLVAVARFDFEDDLLEIDMPFKCYMVRFAGFFDFLSKDYLIDVVVSTVLNNMACTYVSADMDESKLEGAMKNAHELWELCLASVDTFLYNMQIKDDYMKMQQRAMQVLVLRCVKETATVMRMDQIASAFSTALMEEYFKLCEMQFVMSITRPEDENAGAA